MNEVQRKVVGEENGQLKEIVKQTREWTAERNRQADYQNCLLVPQGGFWNCQNGTLYDRKGVHLNEMGLRKYWQSIQGAIRQGLKSVVHSRVSLSGSFVVCDACQLVTHITHSPSFNILPSTL
jgi:hypothetical protein